MSASSRSGRPAWEPRNRAGTASPAQPSSWTQPELRPCVRHTDSGFEVRADEYVPNEARAASGAGRLRGRIAGEIRALPGPAGRVVHAGYGGRRWRGTDVENLLVNNIDQGLTLFRNPGGPDRGMPALPPRRPAAVQ
jgi:hypothetical protein